MFYTFQMDAEGMGGKLLLTVQRTPKPSKLGLNKERACALWWPCMCCGAFSLPILRKDSQKLQGVGGREASE